MALSLLALIAASVYSVFSTSLLGSEKSTNAILAARLAQAKLHEWTGGEWRTLDAAAGTTDDGFQWRRDVSRLVDDPVRDAIVPTLLVTVRVTWQEDGDARSYSLRSIMPTAAGR